MNSLHRSHPGGAHWRVVWVAELLREEGIETIPHFPLDEEDHYEQFLESGGWNYSRTELPSIRRDLRSNLAVFGSLPSSVLRLRRAMDREKIDVVHANGVTNIQPVLAALSLKRPVVWHFNDMQTPAWFVRMLIPLMKTERVHVVVATEAIVHHYGLHNLPRWSYLPAPLPIPKEERAAPVSKSIYGIPAHARLVGFVGNLTPVKGAADFAESAVALMKEHHDLHAVVVGPVVKTQREYADRVKRIVESSGFADRIHFVGFQPNVDAWLRTFDLFLFPSFSEACPIVVLEAMEAGAPMVLARVGDVPRMVETLEVPIVEPGDVAGFVRHGRRLLDEGEMAREALADSMRKRVRKHYSIRRVADLHRDLYQRMTS